MTSTRSFGSAKSHSSLRWILRANGLFSGLGGLACLLGAGSLVALGFPEDLLFSIGVELTIFGTALLLFASLADLRKSWARGTVLAIVGLDALWVLGSLAVLLSPGSLTTGGKWTVGLVALAVADFAFFQFRGWLALGRRQEGPLLEAGTERAAA